MQNQVHCSSSPLLARNEVEIAQSTVAKNDLGHLAHTLNCSTETATDVEKKLVGRCQPATDNTMQSLR